MAMLDEIKRIVATAMSQRGATVHGIVSAIDPVNHAVKVMVQPENVESGWLPVSAMAAGAIRVSRLPDIGEHVRCDPVEGDAEHLVVSGAQYDTITTPPVSPATGKAAQAGELLIAAGQSAPPPTAASTQAGQAAQNAPWWHMTADAIHCGAGNATVTVKHDAITWSVGGVTMALSSGGLKVTGGTIASDTDVLSAGISGKGHVHIGVQPGSGKTGAPSA